MQEKVSAIKEILTDIKNINLKTCNEPWTLTELAHWLTINRKERFKEFPKEYLNLLAKLVQDSHLSLNELSKNIAKTLDATDLTREISQLISKLATRTNFGLENNSIYRWEILDNSCFPTEYTNLLEIEQKKRNLLKEKLNDQYKDLDDQEKKVFLGKKSDKILEKEAKLKEKDAKLKGKIEEKVAKIKEKEAEREKKEAEKLAKRIEKDLKKKEKEKKDAEKLAAKELEKKKTTVNIQGK